MNILFVLRTMDLGGLEVVTSVLANKFVSEGHNVHIFAFAKGKGTAIQRFHGLDLTICNEYKVSKYNTKLLHELLISKQTNIIINQWGLPFIPIKTINKACKGLKTKVITVYHNDPLFNGRIQENELAIQGTKNILKKASYQFKKFLYKRITSFSMAYNYHHSDCYLVLSPSYINHFEQFTGIKKHTKLLTQTNPVTIDSEGYYFDLSKKQNEVLYVGRLDYVQKRVHRVIDTWANIEKKFPNWKLTIVGDGEDYKNIKSQVDNYKLNNVNFVGFQSPNIYYKRAKILILTSEYEGFPLVLAECMSFGVVPIVYGSFSSVYDIIENRKNGYILPCNKGFSAEAMSEYFKTIMNSDTLYKSMAEAAIKTSNKFSVNEIYKSWINIFNHLKI